MAGTRGGPPGSCHRPCPHSPPGDPEKLEERPQKVDQNTHKWWWWWGRRKKRRRRRGGLEWVALIALGENLLWANLQGGPAMERSGYQRSTLRTLQPLRPPPFRTFGTPTFQAQNAATFKAPTLSNVRSSAFEPLISCARKKPKNSDFPLPFPLLCPFPNCAPSTKPGRWLWSCRPALLAQ